MMTLARENIVATSFQNSLEILFAQSIPEEWLANGVAQILI